MIRRPPRSTRTDTLFPYTTLFRSSRSQAEEPVVSASLGAEPILVNATRFRLANEVDWARLDRIVGTIEKKSVRALDDDDLLALPVPYRGALRSEERRGGKEGVSTCRSRWSPYPYKKKSQTTTTNH